MPGNDRCCHWNCGWNRMGCAEGMLLVEDSKVCTRAGVASTAGTVLAVPLFSRLGTALVDCS